jgi:hypothetical protein
MVSTSSISSLGSVRPFIERAFQRKNVARDTPAPIGAECRPSQPGTPPPTCKASGTPGA